jgi:TorA maturation chaperone TorD
MIPVNDELRNLLRDAAEWRLLSVLFEYPVDDWRDRLSAVAADVTDERLIQAAHDAKEQASEGMHHSIFGPGGPVSPREATWTNGVQLGYLLSELNAFYRAFAFMPDTSEPIDHIAFECGFMAYLRLKQAYALACGSSADAESTARAAAEFAAEHLRTVAEPLATSLGHVAPSYLVLAGTVLLDRVGRRVKPLFVIQPDSDRDAAGCSLDFPIDTEPGCEDNQSRQSGESLEFPPGRHPELSERRG